MCCTCAQLISLKFTTMFHYPQNHNHTCTPSSSVNYHHHQRMIDSCSLCSLRLEHIQICFILTNTYIYSLTSLVSVSQLSHTHHEPCQNTVLLTQTLEQYIRFVWKQTTMHNICHVATIHNSHSLFQSPYSKYYNNMKSRYGSTLTNKNTFLGTCPPQTIRVKYWKWVIPPLVSKSDSRLPILL